ncbi:MAG: primase C-terminal domain-containing protein [Dehalococcoidia bacterium]|nr:primase C-terminal domain-containing protein [Dehalococcoidia bacterium]
MSTRTKGLTGVLPASSTEASPQSAYELAFKLLTLGYSIIPVQLVPDDEILGKFKKKPLVPWAQYQKRQATIDELMGWDSILHPKYYGIVTGSVSQCQVIDADSVEAREQIEAEIGLPHIVTPSGGAHWYVEATEHAATRTGIVPCVDCRGEGGYAVVVGLGYSIQRLPHPDNLIRYDTLPECLRQGMNGRKTNRPTPDAISQGERNSSLAKIAGILRRPGLGQMEIEAALQSVNCSRCQPPLPKSEVAAIAESICRYPPLAKEENTCIYERDSTELATNRDGNVTGSVTPVAAKRNKPLSEMVGEWVRENGSGWWMARDLDTELGIQSPEDKVNRRQILSRLQDRGLIEQHPRQAKKYRYVNTQLVYLDFKGARPSSVLPLEWGLGIEEYVNLYPSNLAVVAGAPNSGKTALLLDFIRRNQERFAIYYFCSEMQGPELRDRMELFPGMTVDDWHVQAVERSVDFEQVIVPDAINVIDYLEMTTDLYMVNDHLTAIQDRIGTGLAVVAIQKKAGAVYGRGAEFGLEKPKLYLSMDEGRLTIVKGKSWAKKGENPNRLSIDFTIRDGCTFLPTSDWRRS